MPDPGWRARWTARRIAGIAYLVPVATIAGTWYTFLFVASPAGSNSAALLRQWLLEDPDRALFWWLALVPLACLGLAAVYLLSASQGRAASIAWCAAGILLALAAWRSLDASIAMAVSLPLLASIPATLWQLTRRTPAEA